ncbi:MAG: hypothetical protein A3K60_00690 [Euryarchaeota archaeon RBG_19FT_COMBO_56_21]|nr:MAG: hypothetical protein A3K60_00690 [Euryarchaeota archaeon RBG_19FT_COMBO_56_21]
MFSLKFALGALVIAVFALAAAPFALSVNTNLGIIGALDNDIDDDEYDHDDNDEDDDDDEDDDYDEDTDLVSIVGNVTAWVYDDENEDDEEGNDNMRPEYFVIGNDTYVEFGPWWYWSVGTPNVTSVVHIGDEVNVTGEIEHDGDITIISAWIIENLTTGEKLTIKGEGAPSWAGGPKAFGIDPWPPY